MSNKINVFPDEIRSIVLKDDKTPYGGTAFAGETVGDFLDELDEDEEVYSLEELNEHLVKCGIKPLLHSAVPPANHTSFSNCLCISSFSAYSSAVV